MEEKLREAKEQLNRIIEDHNYDLQHREVIETSRKVDELIASFMSR